MDRKGKKCKECKKGTYEETSVHDDWEGKLHCSECGHEIFRHSEDAKKVQSRVRYEQKKRDKVKEDEDLPPLTFKSFLSILGEELADDVEKLRADISTIDAAINQRLGPLQQQKTRLQKLLANKERQLMNQQKRDQSQMDASQQGAQGSQTGTPGSTGAATPGSQ